MFGASKIIAELATIKANTANHKEDLQEMKETFDKHNEKQEQQSADFDEKVEKIHCKLLNFQCPHDDRLFKLEEKYVKIQKDRAKELVANAEKKAEDIKGRAEVDKGVAEDIASLKSRSKYNLVSMMGLWTTLGIILKKIFTS